MLLWPDNIDCSDFNYPPERRNHFRDTYAKLNPEEQLEAAHQPESMIKHCSYIDNVNETGELLELCYESDGFVGHVAYTITEPWA